MRQHVFLRRPHTGDFVDEPPVIVRPSFRLRSGALLRGAGDGELPHQAADTRSCPIELAHDVAVRAASDLRFVYRGRAGDLELTLQGVLALACNVELPLQLEPVRARHFELPQESLLGPARTVKLAL